jgi:hypothetical protein
MTTFSDGISETTPVLVDGFESTSTTNNIIHRLANGGVSPYFRPHGLRTGTMRLNYGTDEAAARDAELMFANGDVFLVEDVDRPTIEMTVMVSGAITRTLDDETRDVWIVTVDYEELDA